jgi:hypothetical protein
MKESRVKEALEAIARRSVPENTDLWPNVELRLRHGAGSMNAQFKLSWSLVLLILASILVTTVAYALYRYFNDPGLQAAQDAGLITDVNATAQFTVLTPAAAFASGSGSATLIGSTQTLEGVTLKLDWVYLEDARQVFHVSASGLAPDMRFGMPLVTYPDATPEQYRGAIFSLNGSGTITGTYLSNQLVRKDGQPGGKVAMQIDIPVVRRAGGQSTPIANFHFDLTNMEVTVPYGGGGGDSYAVRVNGLEMRMEHAIVTPSYTEAQLCYQLPSPGKDWVLDNVTAQYADPTQLVGEPIAMDSYTQVEARGNERCADVDFPLGKSPGNVSLFVTANGLAAPATQEKMDSTWQFSSTLIDELRIAGVEAITPTPGGPLASETVGDLTATLQRAYADSNRMAFTVHFDGWKEGYSVGNIALRDADGNEVNVGANFQPAESDPTTSTISLTPATELKVNHFKGQLLIDLTDAPAGTPLAQFSFDLDLPVYQALVMEPKQVITANGLEMMLQTVKVAPSYTVVYVCYQKPTPADWMLGDGVSLQIGNDKIGKDTDMLLFDSDFGDLGKGPEPGWKSPVETGRCVKIGFQVGHHGKPDTMILAVDELQQSMPEGIPDSVLKQALAKLKAQGIEIDWMTSSGNGGGGGGVVYKKLPAGVTEAEAYRRLVEALGYIHKGPWVFTIPINP